MAVNLIPEDGSLPAGANTFVTLAEFKTYCENRQFIVNVDDEINSAAIIKAGDYLNNEERFWWRGTRVSDEQGMAWPRAGVVVWLGTGNELATNLVPQKVKDAQCYLAFKQLSADVQPDLDRGGAIASVSAGGVSVNYSDKAMNEVLYQVSQGILKPYLRRDYYLISPALISDDRGYTDPSNPAAQTEDVADRPGATDTAYETDI